MAISFGCWILAQTSRPDDIGKLAKIAETDKQFPRNGDQFAVYKHLNSRGADPEMLEAIADGIAEWRAANGE